MKIIKFNPDKRCPICGKLLKKFTFDYAEWIYQCIDCNYFIHFHPPYLDLRIKLFYKHVSVLLSSYKIRELTRLRAKSRRIWPSIADDYNTVMRKFGIEIKKQLQLRQKKSKI